MKRAIGLSGTVTIVLGLGLGLGLCMGLVVESADAGCPKSANANLTDSRKNSDPFRPVVQVEFTVRMTNEQGAWVGGGSDECPWFTISSITVSHGSVSNVTQHNNNWNNPFKYDYTIDCSSNPLLAGQTFTVTIQSSIANAQDEYYNTLTLSDWDLDTGGEVIRTGGGGFSYDQLEVGAGPHESVYNLVNVSGMPGGPPIPVPTVPFRVNQIDFFWTPVLDELLGRQAAAPADRRTGGGVLFYTWLGPEIVDPGQRLRVELLAVPGVNHPPVCDAGGPYAGQVGGAIGFDGSGSHDEESPSAIEADVQYDYFLDGIWWPVTARHEHEEFVEEQLVVDWAWSFGDGATGSGELAAHVYDIPGSYTVTLIVTDNGGLLTTCSTTADITGPTIVVDGTADDAYGPPRDVQIVQTGFGDSNLGAVDQANGSELDQAFGRIADGMLYVTLAGNLESNFNKLELFIDSAPGGQNRLRGDNPDVDFDGLNRMGDDGTGNGLTFDAVFEPDYYVTVSGGNDPYQLFASYAELLTGGGGIGRYLGEGGAVTDGTLTGGDNPDGIRVTINNSNVAGVTGGTGPDSGAGVTTGVEVAIPLTAIGNPPPLVRVCAFINGQLHDFVSNQLLGPVGWPADNLGEPRAVNLELYFDDQFFEVTGVPDAVVQAAGGLPAAYALSCNVPNPFNPHTLIRYDVPMASRVHLRIYEGTGRLARILEDGVLRQPGRYEVRWDGRSDNGAPLPSGVYFYRLEAGSFIATERMVLVR